MNLPEDIAAAVSPVFRILPFEQALTELVVTNPVSAELSRAVEKAIEDPAIAGRPPLIAGLWLYADELDRSHRVSQGIEDKTGSFWHGIMHRREGDFGNSHYWFNRVGHHPAMDRIPGYDGHAFIDEAAACYKQNSAALIERQRAEWVALFEWCAER